MRALSLALAFAAIPAFAEAQGDGVYGRLDGDVTLEVGLGGGVAFEGPATLGAGVLDLRARYLDMAGILVGAELRPDGASRVLVGIDLRPVWLARFVLGGSLRDRYLDLFLDSIGLDLGVAVLPLDETVGAALMVGFGVDVPLVFFDDGIAGLALRLFGRHVAALQTDRFGPDGGAHDWIAGATLVLRGNASTGLPAWAPRRYELP